MRENNNITFNISAAAASKERMDGGKLMNCFLMNTLTWREGKMQRCAKIFWIAEQLWVVSRGYTWLYIKDEALVLCMLLTESSGVTRKTVIFLVSEHQRKMNHKADTALSVVKKL